MKCTGCQRELGVGDHYIKDSASAFVGKEADPVIDGLIAEIMGGSGAEVVYCEDCTQDGGDWKLETVWGDEDA